jgi:YfiH family protein
VFYRDTQHVYRVAELDSIPWLDLGFGTKLSPEWPPQPRVWLKQIHSDICVAADGAAGCLGEGDALVSNTPGACLAIGTADCIPVLLVDTRLRAIAAVHSGWRGAARAISVKAVAALGSHFGSRPEDLAVAIGPGICGHCYTVGSEVARRFRVWFPERDDLDRPTTLDLTEANRRQLVITGVPPDQIYTGAPCNACSPDEFHSHRRGGQRGRMISAVGIRP